ncbi:hypothetical protein QFC20_003591 [Naganishia adeliensis]|uniref:Uncharacterized protein n=1 Tax=Naganishia adeliensis TaxID=92952 RepID=A0ACC2W8Q1_9TREE|nr:hypothetical protein QFC20_003591 [Naganishia adeliensis]
MSHPGWPSAYQHPSLPPMQSPTGPSGYPQIYGHADPTQMGRHHSSQQAYHQVPYHQMAPHQQGITMRGNDLPGLDSLRIHSPAYQERFQFASFPQRTQPFPPQTTTTSSSASSTSKGPAADRPPPFLAPSAPNANPAGRPTPTPSPAPAMTPHPAETAEPPYTPGHWASQKYEFDHGNQPRSTPVRVSCQDLLYEFVEGPRQMGHLKLAGKGRNRFVQPLIDKMKSYGMQARKPSAVVKRLEEIWSEARSQKTEYENRSTGWGKETGDRLSMDGEQIFFQREQQANQGGLQDRIKATWPMYHRFRDVLGDSASANPLDRHDSEADDTDDRANMTASLLRGVPSTAASVQDEETLDTIDEGDLPLSVPQPRSHNVGHSDDNGEDGSELEEDNRGEDEVMGTSRRRLELDARTARRREEEGLGHARNLSIVSTSSAMSPTSVADDTSQASATTASKGSNVSPGSIVNPRKRKLGERGKGKDKVEDKLMNLHEQDAVGAKAADDRLERQVAKKALLDRERLDMEKDRIKREEERYLAEVERIKEKEKREEERHKLEVARNEDELFFSRYEGFEKLMETRTADKAGLFVWGLEMAGGQGADTFHAGVDVST